MKTLLVLALLALPALAADITGTWKGTAETQNGTFERTFEFKVEGTKLTGETTSARLGKSTILDGKVEGDSLSFDVVVKIQDEERKMHYTGKVNGNEMKLHVEAPNGGFSIDYVAKKVS